MENNLEQRIANGLKEESKGFDEFDLSQIEHVKGKTPDDIKDKCLELCRDYLSGDWVQQTVDTIQVKRMTGGFTNQLYYCGIVEPNPSSEVPQEVAVRFYGQKYFDPTDSEGDPRLPEIVTTLLFSENKLGPHVYAIFEGGQIQKFYKHRQALQSDQKNDKYVQTLFRNLARIHAMNVPIKRNVHWVDHYQERAYREAYERLPIDKDIEEYGCKTLKDNDLKTEMEWVWEACKRTDSPVVFSHNDYRESNLLITEPNDEVVICDFESSAYSPRGQDFQYVMSQWGRDQFDSKTSDDLPPEDSVFGPLIQIYIDESIRIRGKEWAKNPINSVDHILREAKVFLLSGYMFMVTFMLKNDENAHDGFPLARSISMQWADNSFKCYLDLKQRLIDQKIIR